MRPHNIVLRPRTILLVKTKMQPEGVLALQTLEIAFV
jgi:hypothetical protein